MLSFTKEAVILKYFINVIDNKRPHDIYIELTGYLNIRRNFQMVLKFRKGVEWYVHIGSRGRSGARLPPSLTVDSSGG